MPIPRAPLGLALLASLALASCGSRGTVLVALDEAFAAARPALARELMAGPGRRSGYRIRTLPLPLSDSPGSVLAELESLRARGEAPAALVASPLLAASLPGPWRAPGTEPSSIGETRLLVPEWPPLPAAPAGCAAARTDPLPAYAAAGRASGAYIAALRAQGGSAAGAILFREAPSRPRAALEAFAAAFGEASGGLSPLARELPSSDEAASAAEAAVRELLGSDIRLLFVAVGGGGPAAMRAAERPGLTVGADYSGADEPGSLDFRLCPDDRALARSLWAALPGSGGGPRNDAISAIIVGSKASTRPSGRLFKPFLREATRLPGKK